MYDIREAKDEDRESAIRLLWKAHSVTDNLDEVRKEHWAQGWHSPEKKDWSYVATEGNEVVANVSFFEDRANIIRGKSVPFSAVWGVATLPQHRRKGLIRKLMVESFKSMRERGMYLSILAPFFKTYYEMFGYAMAESRVKHEFPRRILRIIKGDPRITNRELVDPSEAKKAQEIEKSMARFGSRNFHTLSTIERMIKENHFHIFERDSKPIATVKFHFDQVKDDVLDLRVNGPAFASLDVFPSIVELVGNYSPNITTVRWIGDPQMPVRYYMDDWYDCKTSDYSAMMMRVVDIEGYCGSISIPSTATESVVIKLDDKMCPWNQGTFRLSPNGTSLECERLEDSAESDVSINALGLSEIIGGLTPALTLHSLRKLDCSRDIARKLEALFPADSFVSYQRF
jgi:predicted acetyltransferase